MLPANSDTTDFPDPVLSPQPLRIPQLLHSHPALRRLASSGWIEATWETSPINRWARWQVSDSVTKVMGLA